jgi:hypothetical protein
MWYPVRCIVLSLRGYSIPEVFNLFCSRTPRYNFSSTLYPPNLLVYNSSYTYYIIYIQNKLNKLRPK